jgi:hypothetical protein
MNDRFSEPGLTELSHEQRSLGGLSLGVDRWSLRGESMANAIRAQRHGLGQRCPSEALAGQAQRPPGWGLAGATFHRPAKPPSLQRCESDPSGAIRNSRMARDRLSGDGLNLIDQIGMFGSQSLQAIPAWPVASVTVALPPPPPAGWWCKWIYACRASFLTEYARCARN